VLRATADTLVEVTRGRLLSGPGEHSVSGLVVDSREVRAGCAFVALPGERTDGHDHLIGAIEAGAHALIVTRVLDEMPGVQTAARQRGVAVILVADSVRALADIASYHRAGLRCQVVAITGSTGKTTTKDLLASVLATSFRTVSTAGNRNNEIGLPLTIMSAGPETDVLVVEMGMRGAGQIARLAAIARPSHGLVTNVGTSHIELLGTRDAIAEAKGELVRAIPVEGRVCLNGDDDFSVHIAELSAAPVTLYGLGETCSVRAADVRLDEQSCPSFTLSMVGIRVPVRLRVRGRHNVYNALAAAAIALALGVDPCRIAGGLEGASITGMRMETFMTASGVTVINDTYNANPTSMIAAVDTLSALKVPGRRCAVLGDMAELGSLEELAHFELGEHVAGSGIELLVTVGERARRISDGAKAEGMAEDAVFRCATIPEALETLDDIIESEDAVLVKASRVMGLEAIVEGLVNSRVC
jgi:UDP-N-acetylmuramoyl-tripeptide--D-alanyl-D-alanine ligase